MDNTVTISLNEYRMLIAEHERIEILKRFISLDNLISTQEVETILDIVHEEEEDV